MGYKETKTELLKQAQTTPLQSDTIEEWLVKGGNISQSKLWELIKSIDKRISNIEQSLKKKSGL